MVGEDGVGRAGVVGKWVRFGWKALGLTERKWRRMGKISTKKTKGEGRSAKRPYIAFERPELVSLSRALTHEFLSTNHSGGYMSTTCALCNTRKYHGLMVLPLEHFGGERHVLLSTLDETLTVNGQEFHLGVRRFPGVYEPRGHKYLVSFRLAPTPTFVYRVGDIVLQKELLFAHTQEHLMVRYTLLEGSGTLKFSIRPFLSFRNSHALSHANLDVDVKFTPVPNGASGRMYPGFPTIYLQTNVASEYVHAPDWHYNVEYSEEYNRGYDCHEDLFVPGYFECTLKAGQPLVFSAATKECNPRQLLRSFNAELEKRPRRDDFISTLQAAAEQFLADHGHSMYVVAGYPWFGRWGRDTLIALPGLTLPLGHVDHFERVMTSLVKEMKDGLLPNMGRVDAPAFNSVDAPLWLFRAVEEYCDYTGDYARACKLWGRALRSVLDGLTSDGQLPFSIGVRENGLLWAGEMGQALTWMDAVVNGRPVTPRTGFDVEINALWYNALCFMQRLYAAMGRGKDAAKMEAFAARVRESFVAEFWLPEMGYLADYVDGQGANTFVRPNQLLAVSLPSSPLTAEQQAGVLETVRRELYTPLGLRTLSPKNPNYKPHYGGGQAARDEAYHQGTIWPFWLSEYLCATRRVKGEYAAQTVGRQILEAMEQEMQRYGLGTIGEVFDGDPPHTPGGTYAQAWSVAAVQRVAEYMHPERFVREHEMKKA